MQLVVTERQKSLAPLVYAEVEAPDGVIPMKAREEERAILQVGL